MRSPRISNPRICSINDAMDILGRKWVVVIIRELLLKEKTRFDEIVHETGIPRDILSGRLRDLERDGLVTRSLYSEHPRRFEYGLTDAGQALYGVVQSIRTWGDRHLRDDPAYVSEFIHDCGEPFHARVVCSKCSDEFVVGDSHTVVDYHQSDLAAV